jgi:NADH-ubiquinone oxidoreductase chain 1
MVFLFILVRASYPRLRFDGLMAYCWTNLLPITIALIIFIPCIIGTFKLFVNNICI